MNVLLLGRPRQTGRNILAAITAIGLLCGTTSWGAGNPVELTEDADGVQRATVKVDSYSYTPDRVIVRAGRPVELTLVSMTTLTPHNFVLKDLSGGSLVEREVGAGTT